MSSSTGTSPLSRPGEDAQEVRDAEASLQHLRGVLRRPGLEPGIAVKARWSIEGLERWLANARRRL